jgi:hypothetical protein
VYQHDKQREYAMVGMIPAIAVCKALGLSPSTVNRKLDAGKISGMRDGKRRFISVEWLRSNYPIGSEERAKLDILIAEVLDDAL